MSTPSGYSYSHTVGMNAETGKGFFDPVDLALASDGVIFVISRGGFDFDDGTYPIKRVTVCTVDEQYLGQFSRGGFGDGDLMWPASIALDRDDKLYISDESLQRISIFTREGRYLGKWGVKGNGEGEFDRPAGIAFDADDNLLVVDGLNCRVQKYSKDGRYLGGWGSAGAGDGELNVPWGISIDRSGNVYVADWRNDRIQKFDGDGKHLASWGRSGQGDGEFNRPAGVAVDHEGNVIVADWGNERVQVLGPDGMFRASFRGESGVSSWGTEYFISNQDELQARQTSNLEPEPDADPDDYLRDESGAVEKLFWGPTAVKVDAQGRFYVVESARHRIQIYSKQS